MFDFNDSIPTPDIYEVIFFRTFARFAQKNFQIMRRRSRTSMKNIFTQTKRSAIVLQGAVVSHD